MPETLHRTPSLTISVSSASVWLHIAHGPADLPLHLEVTGEALAGLVVAAQRAWAARGGDASPDKGGRIVWAKWLARRQANDARKGVGNG